MHIIVDGYNLIRQSIALRQAERQSLEEGRKALLLMLNEYSRKKGHRVTVVFDGWEGGSPCEERDYFGETAVIYSPLGEKADEVIKRIVADRNDNFVVVSSDRAIASFAISRGYSAIAALDFEKRLWLSTGPDDAEAVPVNEDETEGRISTKKRGVAHRLSRTKRREQIVLRKL
ncbi:MAG: NYN domain-containing protein [Deltaproteobacteria bacterium]|nr:NYN domain-containing protein [Deltaproteobacteria bacterium]